MTKLASSLRAAVDRSPVDLLDAWFLASRIECPSLDPEPARVVVDQLQRALVGRLSTAGRLPVRERLAHMRDVFYDVGHFSGGTADPADARHSLAHTVIERRQGIPVSLAILYILLARGSGLEVFGVGFPGHFLLRVPADTGEDGPAIIVDPVDGRELTPDEIRLLWAEHGGDAPWHDEVLRPCSSRQIVGRVLNNLRNIYIETHSHPQARAAVDALIALGVNPVENLRYRGLLAFAMEDTPSALRDLEAYISHTQHSGTTEERQHVQDQLMTIRRRVAAMN